MTHKVPSDFGAHGRGYWKDIDTRAPAFTFGYQGKETGIYKRTGKDAETQGIKCAQ
jgi:hypothetical protein